MRAWVMSSQVTHQRFYEEKCRALSELYEYCRLEHVTFTLTPGKLK